MSIAPKTAVLWMPPGAGKSTHAQAIAALLGCTHVVDEWTPGVPMQPGALHLTNAPLTDFLAAKPSPDTIAQLTALLRASQFVTIGEAAKACGMTAATVTAQSEGMLRSALEAAGCERAKREASDGVRRWGYVSPYFLAIRPPAAESACAEQPAALHTPQAPTHACSRCSCRCAASPSQPTAPQPAAPLAPTELGQCALAPCSASPECENGSVQTGGAA